MGGDECNVFKNPIGGTFLSGKRIFIETGLRRELSRTKVSAIREAPAPLGRGNFTTLLGHVDHKDRKTKKDGR
jgi:hypothetical protein